MVASSLQSRHNFGGWVLSIFLTNIMAAIKTGGEKEICTERAVVGQK